MERKQNIAVLGSTGSIGMQTLDIISQNAECMKAGMLTANKNWEHLAQQARKYNPELVVIADEEYYEPLKGALSDTSVRVMSGSHVIAECMHMPEIDTVVTAMVGYAGLESTIEAVKAGKRIALANKETLVVGGELIMGMLPHYGAEIIPVDSEHSAIFQCLRGEKHKSIDKIILTASGGPFRTWSAEQMKTVRPEDALKHPRWDMGAKVTIDSASMMNKGFEMIEARWLFGVEACDIEVLVHPQSIVHSMVRFIDGSYKAQLGVTDMHLPIRYALGYPERLHTSGDILDFAAIGGLTFERPDPGKFPLLSYAYSAISKGGNMPCILNAANEIAVAAFLSGRLGFTEMPGIVSDTMGHISYLSSPTYEDLVATNSEARHYAETLIRK